MEGRLQSMPSQVIMTTKTDLINRLHGTPSYVWHYTITRYANCQVVYLIMLRLSSQYCTVFNDSCMLLYWIIQRMTSLNIELFYISVTSFPARSYNFVINIVT